MDGDWVVDDLLAERLFAPVMCWHIVGTRGSLFALRRQSHACGLNAVSLLAAQKACIALVLPSCNKQARLHCAAVLVYFSKPRASLT
jgi:hypothetical protein